MPVPAFRNQNEDYGATYPLKPFTYSFCNCCAAGFPFFCSAIWCLPCVTGHISANIGKGLDFAMAPYRTRAEWMDITRDGSKELFGEDCCNVVCTAIIPPMLGLVPCTVREQARLRLNIEDNCCTDCCLPLMFPPCSMIQVAAELQERKAFQGTCCVPAVLEMGTDAEYGYFDTPITKVQDAARAQRDQEEAEARQVREAINRAEHERMAEQHAFADHVAKVAVREMSRVDKEISEQQAEVMLPQLKLELEALQYSAEIRHAESSLVAYVKHQAKLLHTGGEFDEGEIKFAVKRFIEEFERKMREASVKREEARRAQEHERQMRQKQLDIELERARQASVPRRSNSSNSFNNNGNSRHPTDGEDFFDPTSLAVDIGKDIIKDEAIDIGKSVFDFLVG